MEALIDSLIGDVEGLARSLGTLCLLAVGIVCVVSFKNGNIRQLFSQFGLVVLGLVIIGASGVLAPIFIDFGKGIG